MSKLRGDPGYRGGWCIYYIAPGKTKDNKCEAGVDYNDVRGEKFQERPCFLDKGQSKPGSVHCDKLRRPTAEEMAAHDEWAKMRQQKFGAVMLGVHSWRVEHKGQSAAAVLKCPACGGRLHVSISGRNGHMHGKCETDGCVSWME